MKYIVFILDLIVVGLFVNIIFSLFHLFTVLYTARTGGTVCVENV